MPSKKSTKVIELNETTEQVVEEIIPPVKTKSKKQVKETTTEPVEQESNKVTKPKKVTKVTEPEQADEPEKVKPKKETKSKKVADDSEPEKVTKSKKETKPKKVPEPKHIEVTSQSESITEPKDQEQIVNDPELQELEETKKYWLNIADKIHDNNLEREKLEAECTQIIKRLNELLDKYTNKQDEKEGFKIDNKVQVSNTKNKIINADDSESSSDSESDQESDSDEKPTLTKKTKSKPLIKTTKGNSSLKLANNDSDTDSD